MLDTEGRMYSDTRLSNKRSEREAKINHAQKEEEEEEEEAEAREELYASLLYSRVPVTQRVKNQWNVLTWLRQCLTALCTLKTQVNCVILQQQFTIEIHSHLSRCVCVFTNASAHCALIYTGEAGEREREEEEKVESVIAFALHVSAFN